MVIWIRGKKGFAPILIALVIWLIFSLLVAALIKASLSCSMFGFMFLGSLLLVAAIMFGVTGNLTIGGVSGFAAAVFYFIGAFPCFGFG